MELITYATDKQKAQVLLRSARINGFDTPTILGEGLAWGSFIDKFIPLMKYLGTVRPDTLVMFMDGYDTVLYAGPDEIEKLYRQHFDGTVVFNAEVNCWPDANLATLYPQCDSPYKYLNSGMFIGPAGLIHKFMQSADPSSGKGSDQRIWTRLFLGHQTEIAVDVNCIIFQTSHKHKGLDFIGGRLYNNATNTYPLAMHTNGGGDVSEYDIYKGESCMNTTLPQWAATYTNTKECHREIVDTFKRLVTSTDYLNAHRSLVEKEVYGFGERSFHWMWKLIVDEMQPGFNMLEIGVYKGQVISLVRLLADRRGIGASIHGVTPLSTFSGETGKFTKFPDTDYRQHIINLHNLFGLSFDPDKQLIVGDSNDPEIVERVRAIAPFDIVYVDGCHEYEYVARDILNYGPMLKRGGYLVIDDSSNFLDMPNGYFTGIEDVSRAVADTIERDSTWQPVLTVMHNRVFRKR